MASRRLTYYYCTETTTTQIYTLSLHDALPISGSGPSCGDGTCSGAETCATCVADCGQCPATCGNGTCDAGDRKSTRLNSSHVEISYAVFCLKKKIKAFYFNYSSPLQNPERSTK